MDPFALIDAMLERPARSHLVSALDLFDAVRQALMDTPGYDRHMRLAEQFRSADGCFTAFCIRDEALGSASKTGVSFVLADMESLSESRLRDGLAAVMTKLVGRLLHERGFGGGTAIA
ncbi:hypothetical protein [Methylobacterium sp. CM6257]|jgi:hypothetical protein